MRSFNLGLALLLCACGSANGAGTPNSAGASGTPGGSSGGSGGASASGGSTVTGGATATGGTSASGGAMAATGGAAHAGSGGNSPIGAGGMVTAVGCPTSQSPGTWLNVTDPAMKMTGDFVNGPLTVNVDPAKPSDVYVHVQHDGTWKSTDCGMTYKKVSTGLNAAQQDTGSQWGAVIDPNPKRDPATPPTIYVNQGYGALGLWKSTNGGVDWTNVFNGNIYAADGVTNISKIVGTDTAAPFMLSSDNADHLVIFMHGCWNCGANDGIFETTDGAGKWVLHPTPNFDFQPHSDLLSAINAKTWWVDHGYPATVWRSTNAGATWVQSTGSVANGMGHSIARVGTTGTTYYTGSDYRDGVFKTTDDGASWSHTAAPGNQVSWVATTATHVYASNGYTANPHILVASLADDTKWVDQGNPQGMVENGANNPGVLFDGEHYVIIAAQARGGAWRYVEP